MRVNKADFTAAKEQVLYRKNENTVSVDFMMRHTLILTAFPIFAARRIVLVKASQRLGEDDRRASVCLMPQAFVSNVTYFSASLRPRYSSALLEVTIWNSYQASASVWV